VNKDYPRTEDGAIDFRALLRLVQMRWPITLAKRAKRRAAKALASICWQVWRVMYRKMPALAVELGVERVAWCTWRTLHPWSKWSIELLTQTKHLDDVYAALRIAHNSMTIEDRIVMAHRNERLTNGHCI
jgi:hypothetical protein